MKKIIFIALLTFAMNAKAQITLEHTYDTAAVSPFGLYGAENQLMIVDFAVLGDKYVRINIVGMTINIYNMNHSLNKSISFASFPLGTDTNPTIYYLSQNLFTTDSKIAFMYIYTNPGPVYTTTIYNEDGTQIFSVDSMVPNSTLTNDFSQQFPIYNTSAGTKMILIHQYQTGQAKVYSLPGTLVTCCNSGSGIESYAPQPQSNISNPYPNPNNNSTKIDYELPQGINEGEIVFYNLQGAEVKRFKVDRTFNTLLISTSDLAAGTYLYQLQTSAQSSEGKKMVVIK